MAELTPLVVNYMRLGITPIGILLNSMLLFTIVTSHHLRASPHYLLIAALASVDLLALLSDSIISIPMKMGWLPRIDTSLLFYCIAVRCLNIVSALIAFTLLIIAVERYCFFFSIRAWNHLFGGKSWLVTVTSTFALVITGLLVVTYFRCLDSSKMNNIYLLTFIVLYIGTFLIVFIIYSFIFGHIACELQKLRAHVNANVREGNQCFSPSNHILNIQLESGFKKWMRHRKMLIGYILVTGSFWLVSAGNVAFFSLYLMNDVENLVIYFMFSPYITLLATLHSATNPFIYAWTQKCLQRTFWKIFCTNQPSRRSHALSEQRIISSPSQEI